MPVANLRVTLPANTPNTITRGTEVTVPSFVKIKGYMIEVPSGNAATGKFRIVLDRGNMNESILPRTGEPFLELDDFHAFVEDEFQIWIGGKLRIEGVNSDPVNPHTIRVGVVYG